MSYRRPTAGFALLLFAALAGCTVTMSTGPGTAPAQPAAAPAATAAAPPAPASASATAPAPVVSHQVTQATCNFTANKLQGAVGSRHVVSCPVNCYATGATWGTDLYTADSTICRAGIHAGLVRNDIGGTIAVILEPGQPAYRGSLRNTIQSSDFGTFRLSFRLSRM